MVSSTDNEALGSTRVDYGVIERIDGVRKELDGKIDGKLSHAIFFSILGVIVVIYMASMGYLCTQLGKLYDKNELLTKQTTVLETLINQQKR